MVVIIFDLETSGLNPYHDDIIEIGAKILQGDSSFQMLVKPKSGRPVSKKITQITGITNRDLRTNGQAWGQAYQEFYNWFFENTKDKENITLVSHNGDTFDFVFFRRMLNDLSTLVDKVNIDVEKINFIDTLPLSKRLYPNRTYYNQPSLARTFSIIVDNAHRAMGDVIVLEQLYSRIMIDFKINTKIDGLEDPPKVREFIDLKM
jgi:DNA polymerase III alpha subunit (gram-positive type)